MSVKKIFHLINKYMFKRKHKYFFDFSAKIYNKVNKKKNTIHNKLFNDSKKRQKIISYLEQKFYEDEEKMCTFSPKTNKGEIKCRPPANNGKDGLFEIKVNDPRYSYSLLTSSVNIGKNFDDNNTSDKINQFVIINEDFAKSNPLFYKDNNNSKNRVKIVGENSYNSIKFPKYDQLLNDRDIFYYDYNIKNKNKINNISKNDLFIIKNINSNDSFFEENGFNKTSRNYCYIKKSKTTNKNSSSACLNNYKNILNNLGFNPHKTNRNKVSILNDYMLIENKNKCSQDNTSNLFRTQTNIKKTPNNLNKNNNRSDNYEKEIKNKSLNDLYNIREYEIINSRNKNKNSLQKNNMNIFNGVNPIKIFSCKNKNNYERVLYEPIYKNNKEIIDNIDNNKIIHNKSKSFSSNHLFREISSPFLNNINKIKEYNSNNIYDNHIIRNYEDLNYMSTNSNEIINENELNNYFSKSKTNKAFYKKEYYYTFRKDKIPYNSFNYLSTKKSKNTNINQQKRNPISLIEVPRIIKSRYNSNINYTNSIYLNNYNKKVCKIKKNKFIKNGNNSFNKNNNINNKGSFYDLTYKKDSTRQFSNTNYNTNNETKGGSISSFSLYPTKSPKDNLSIKNSSRKECNNSIPNSKTKNIGLSKQSNINKRKFKKKNKQSIRKYINSINSNNMESIVQNVKKGLKYYCYNSNEKNNESKNENLEIDYNVVNECFIHSSNSNKKSDKKKKCLSYGSSSGKKEKSMTLQSLSDSKMLELADHYINNDEDSLGQMDLKLIELRNNIKKEKTYRDITFG